MYNFWLNWDKFWYKLLAKPEILSTSRVVPRGIHLCVRNDIRCLPRDFLYRGNIELYECPVKFWNYSGFISPFYTLIEFLDI